MLELKAPARRQPSMPLEALLDEINAFTKAKVEVVGPLRFSSRAEPARLKSAEAQKTYTIRFTVDGPEPLGEPPGGAPWIFYSVLELRALPVIARVPGG